MGYYFIKNTTLIYSKEKGSKTMNIATAIANTELRMDNYIATQEEVKNDEKSDEKNDMIKGLIMSLENDICACKIAIRCMKLIEQDIQEIYR